MKNVLITTAFAALLGLAINALTAEFASPRPAPKIGAKLQTIEAGELKTPLRTIPIESKLAILKTVVPNAKLEALGVPVKLDLANPQFNGVAGLDFFVVRQVKSSGNHASVEFKTNNGEIGEIDVWFKPLEANTYIVGCNIYGKGEFTLLVNGEAATKKKLEGDGNIMAVVTPNPGFVKSFVSLSGVRTANQVNWIFYGCEITPVKI